MKQTVCENVSKSAFKGIVTKRSHYVSSNKTIQVNIFGDTENCIDICRFVIAELKCKYSVLVCDASTNMSLYASVFAGSQAYYQDMYEFRKVHYTSNFKDVQVHREEYDYVILYSNPTKICDEYINDSDDIFLCYGVSRLSFQFANVMAQKLRSMGCSCTLVSRKEKRDSSVNELAHVVKVDKLYIVPKGIIDYNALERADYGLYDANKISVPMYEVVKSVLSLYSPA